MKRKAIKSWEQVPLVEVIWRDAVINTDHEGQLCDREGEQKFGGLATYSDIGYLIRKTATEIVLAVSICRDDSTYRHSNTIPRGWVKAINHLHRPNDQPPDPPADDSLPPPGDGPLR